MGQLRVIFGFAGKIDLIPKYIYNFARALVVTRVPYIHRSVPNFLFCTPPALAWSFSPCAFVPLFWPHVHRPVPKVREDSIPLVWCEPCIYIQPSVWKQELSWVSHSSFIHHADSGKVSFSECDIPAEDRLDCGYYGIQLEECQSRGCCWQSSDIPGTNWCYHSGGKCSASVGSL